MTYTLYTREKGPLCYELRVFPYRTSFGAFFSKLFGSSLQWYWESELSEPPTEAEGEEFPAFRPVTAFTEATAAEFVRDSEQRDIDGCGRFVALYGADPAAKPDSSFRDWLRRLLETFLQSEEGPLWLIVIQIGDCWQSTYM